jgi:hypothetical protein
MNRREAVGLFREICRCIPELSVLDSVSLRTQNEPFNSEEKSFMLQINAALSSNIRNNVRAIANKHQLEMEEYPNSILIFAPRTVILEIVA